MFVHIFIIDKQLQFLNGNVETIGCIETSVEEPDQIVSSEASWSVKTLFSKGGYALIQQDTKIKCKLAVLTESSIIIWKKKCHPTILKRKMDWFSW